MPVYEYRCNQCKRPVTLAYKTYKDFDAATPTCPHCQSTDLTRLISRVGITRPSRDFSSMSSEDMLSVLNTDNPREIGQMMQQVAQTEPDVGPEFQEVTERLLKGEDPERIENDLSPDLGASLGGDDL